MLLIEDLVLDLISSKAFKDQSLFKASVKNIKKGSRIDAPKHTEFYINTNAILTIGSIQGEDEVFWFTLAIGTIGGLLFSLFAVFVCLPVFLWRNEHNRKEKLIKLV